MCHVFLLGDFDFFDNIFLLGEKRGQGRGGKAKDLNLRDLVRTWIWVGNLSFEFNQACWIVQSRFAIDECSIFDAG